MPAGAPAPPARATLRRGYPVLGYERAMTDEPGTEPVDEERVQHRAELTGEEQAAGSADPVEQARLILEDSDVRQTDRDASPGTILEHRTSDETVEPDPE